MWETCASIVLPLSFNTNYDRVTVLKQSANRAIILAKVLSYASRIIVKHAELDNRSSLLKNF